MEKNMDRGKLAVCIPTYHRSEVIEEFIEIYINWYVENKVDIFIYDSSKDEKTELVVKRWLPEYPNLFYVRIDSSIHSNMKVYNIFKEFGYSLQYEYLWVCSDSIRWTRRVLDKIKDSIEQGYDIIIPNYRDVENIGDREYQDANTLFIDCAWHMTLYGATILKISTMLKEVDWEILEERYAVPECINHSHVAYYFEKLNKMQNWKALHISCSNSDLIASELKKYPGWQKDTFYVWCYCWPAMINKLPDSYKNKKKVIKKSGVNSSILSYSNFIVLRKENILNKEIYDSYKRKWRDLTNVPRMVIWLLTIIPSKYVTYMDGNMAYKQLIKEVLLKREIKRFCRRFNKIYIYGAGRKAKRYTCYLEEMGLKFEGYIVSSLEDNDSTMYNHKIFLFRRELLDDKNIGILIALNKENTKEVLGNVLSGARHKKLFIKY